jgi:hypothetical protein
VTQNLPPDFLKRLAAVKNKRARAVIDRILQNGYVTTEELKNIGYNHPPRAARDVREEGIPLETFYDKLARDGSRMASYRFADLSKVRHDRIGGRVIFKKEFKNQLIDIYGNRCNICSGPFEDRYLQIDHRVPYEVGGDTDRETNDYQLLDGSCNRAKSWSCEHCENWTNIKDPDICKNCYWAAPESCEHVAMRKIRRLDVLWDESEVKAYDEIKKQSDKAKTSMPDFVKAILKTLLKN